MKVRWLPVVALFLSATIEAQSARVGARAGVTMAKQVDELGTSATLPGYSAGIAAVFEVATWIGYEVDLFYTQKGWRERSAWVGLDYVELPMLMRLAVPLTDIDAGPDLGLQPFIVMGLSQALLVSCNRSIGVDNPNVGNTALNLRRPRTDDNQFPSCNAIDRHHADQGVVFGFGLTVRRLHKHITIELRQDRGMADLTSGRAFFGCTECTVKNRVTSVLFGVVARK